MAIVASPVSASEEELVSLAKKFKKNSVAVDLINVGESCNVAKLEAFIAAVSSNENSYSSFSHF